MNTPNESQSIEGSDAERAQKEIRKKSSPGRRLFFGVVVAAGGIFLLAFGISAWMFRGNGDWFDGSFGISLFMSGLTIPLVLVVPFLRWIFRTGHWKRFLFGAACLATLVALLYTEENWRGKRAWEKYKRELEAQGERLDWQAGLLPRVPEEQNFVNTPLLQAIGYKNKVDQKVMGQLSVYYPSTFVKTPDGKFTDFEGIQNELRNERKWKKKDGKWISDPSYELSQLTESPATNMLLLFKKIEPQIDELRQASQRPYAQFAVEGNPFEVAVPNFVACRTLVQIFSLRACAELALGQPDEALKDIRVIHKLADALRASPVLVSTMIRVAITGIGLESFWEGWARNQWSDAQLEEFQKYFASIDLLNDLDNSWRLGERNGINALADSILRGDFVQAKNDSRSTFKAAVEKTARAAIPSGWVCQNQLLYTRLMQSAAASWSVKEQRVFPEKGDEFMAEVEEVVRRHTPFKFLAAIGVASIQKATRTTAQNQTLVNEAMLACALERYRRVNGQFPETLEMLVPKFTAKIPHDMINGQPLKYRRTNDGNYLLYSVALDGKDDGGAAIVSKNGAESGDWVWFFPVEK